MVRPFFFNFFFYHFDMYLTVLVDSLCKSDPKKLFWNSLDTSSGSPAAVNMRMEGGILLTCAVDTDHKKASRQPHLPASMLNSSLVLSAITCEAEGMHSPYVALGWMQSAQNSEKESASERGEVCVCWVSIFYLTHLYSMCICVPSLFLLCLWSF